MVGLRGFPVDHEFHTVVWFPDNESVQEWDLPILFAFNGEFEVASLINAVEVLGELFFRPPCDYLENVVNMALEEARFAI